MKKKLLKLFITPFVCCMLTFGFVGCRESGLHYELSSDGTYYSVSWRKSGADLWSKTDVVIPADFQNIPVTTIGDNAFDDCDNLTSVTIPDSVTSIGEDAFWHCDRLANITIPDSVTFIGDEAFSVCDSLTNVTIGNSVTHIGARTFYACHSLTSVTIGGNVTSIGNEAFSWCNSLTTVYYTGRTEDWKKISISSCSLLSSNANTPLTNATRYYYSESEPALNSDGSAYDGKYWRYVNGIATPWIHTQ